MALIRREHLHYITIVILITKNEGIARFRRMNFIMNKMIRVHLSLSRAHVSVVSSLYVNSKHVSEYIFASIFNLFMNVTSIKFIAFYFNGSLSML